MTFVGQHRHRAALAFGLLALLAVTSPLAVSAQIPTHIVPCGIQSLPTGDPRSEPCSICHIGVAVMNLTNFGIYAIAIPLIALLVAVGGIIMLISAGSEERVKLGKRILTNAIVGAVIVFVAWLTVDSIIKLLTGGYEFLIYGSGVGPWHTIDPGFCGL